MMDVEVGVITLAFDSVEQNNITKIIDQRTFVERRG